MLSKATFQKKRERKARRRRVARALRRKQSLMEKSRKAQKPKIKFIKKIPDRRNKKMHKKLLILFVVIFLGAIWFLTGCAHLHKEPVAPSPTQAQVNETVVNVANQLLIRFNKRFAELEKKIEELKPKGKK